MFPDKVRDLKHHIDNLVEGFNHIENTFFKESDKVQVRMIEMLAEYNKGRMDFLAKADNIKQGIAKLTQELLDAIDLNDRVNKSQKN